VFVDVLQAIVVETTQTGVGPRTKVLHSTHPFTFESLEKAIEQGIRIDVSWMDGICSEIGTVCLQQA
jgi:hypothetical protein